MLNKKVLAAAVIGTLFAGSAAATDFTAGNAAAVAATAPKYAKEIKIDATNGTSFAAVAANNVTWLLGQNLSPGEVKYVRIEADSHVEFNSAVPSIVTADTGAITIGAVNGVGTNVITFSITADPGNGVADATAATKIQLAAAFSAYESKDSSIKVSLYDTSSQSQQGGANGLNTFGSYSNTYFTFGNSLRWVSTPQLETADVSATPSYTLFVAGGATHDVATLNTGLSIATVAGGTLTAAGGAVTVGTLLSGANSSVTIEGDFSFIRSSGGYDTNAKNRAVAFGTTAASTGSSLGADAATFNLATAFGGVVTLGAKVHTATFNPVISASTYTAKLNAAAATPATYNVPVLANTTVGEIDRNGLTLIAPLAQTPGGWKSRLVLTNTSGVARPYTISVLTETGVTATLGANATGTIPANGTKVIDDLSTVFTTNDAPRGTLVVDIASRNTDVEGLYQIVNPDKGSISNHVLVRPGNP